MDSPEWIKNSLNKGKIKEIFENILMEDSVLNYPIFDLGLDLEKISKKVWQKVYDINWPLVFKKSEQVLREKMSLLAIACVSAFCWMFFSGVLAYNFPEDFSLYAQGAHGESAQESVNIAVPPTPKTEENPILNNTIKPKENSITEAKCAEDTKKNRSSDLCADISGEKKLIEKMNEEELITLENNRQKLAAKKSIQMRKSVRVGPMPYVFEVVAGRRVCNKSNDHPSNSKNNKKGHMDMECCLDPDETPNPNCYYPAKKYGKYL